MKKLIFSLSALAALFLAGSCQRENLEPVQQGGTVTYTVQVPASLQTKALGEGYVLNYEVYRAAEVGTASAKPVYESVEPIAFNNAGVASFDLEFVKNQKFVVLFWAQTSELQNAENPMFNITDLRNVQLVNCGAANNPNAAVFAGKDVVENCVSTEGGAVELVRPISQLNIYTTKESLEFGTGITLDESYVKVSGLYKTYNVAEGAAVLTTTTETYEYALNDVPETASTDQYAYVAMNYVGFADNANTVVDVEFSIKTSEVNLITHSVGNVPVKPNYKTNIIGNLITATDKYQVTLGAWGTPDTNVEVVAVSTAQDLQEAIENIQPGGAEGNIILEGNIDLGALFGASTLSVTKAGNEQLPIVIEENKAMTLDLNGFIITTPWEDETAGKHYYAFKNYGTLNIVDSKVKGKIIARGIFNYGKMTLESGTIEACDCNGGYGVRNYEGAEFVMNGGTIATIYEDDDEPKSGNYDACPIRVDEGAKAEINGGIIDNVSNFTVAIDNYGETIVNDGTFTSVHTTLANSASMTINGGSFTCNGLEGITAHALWAAAGRTTINCGTFNGKDNYNGFNVDADKGAVVNITGGEFLPVHSGSLYGEGTINVTGGTFFDNPSARIVPGYEATQNEEGKYVVTKMPDLAKIGETAYYSLQMAIDAAEDNQTVVLISDVVLNSSVEIADLTYENTQSVAINVPAGKKLTLDLNGHNIETSTTMTGEFTGGRAHVIGNLGDLTIVDNGSTKGAIISNTSDANKGGFTIFNQASLTVEGVTIVGNNGRSYALTTRGKNAVTVVNNCTVYGRGGIAVEGGCNVTINGENTLCYSNETIRSTSHALYIGEGNVTINAGTFRSKEVYNGFVIDHGAGNLTINGGTFVGHHNGETLNNCLHLSGGSTGTAVINAGTFTHGIEGAGNSTGSVVVKGGSFGQDVTKYLADGYELTENEGRYTVRQLPAAKIGETEYETLEAAVAAAKADDTIVVLRNIELPEYKLALPANSTLVVNANVAIKTLSAVNGCTITIKEGKTVALNNFSFGSKDTADAEYEIAGGKVVANYGFFQHGEYALRSDFETGYMYYSFGSDITVYGTFHSQGKGDGLDYVRGKLTIAEGGRSIHDKSLWVGQPASWGEMNASLIIEAGGYVQANSLSVYEGSSLTYYNDADLKYNSLTGIVTKQ